MENAPGIRSQELTTGLFYQNLTAIVVMTAWTTFIVYYVIWELSAPEGQKKAPAGWLYDHVRFYGCILSDYEVSFRYWGIITIYGKSDSKYIKSLTFELDQLWFWQDDHFYDS